MWWSWRRSSTLGETRGKGCRHVPSSVVISQPMFLPWLGMFEQACIADDFVHYDDVQFSKGSFSNRVQLKMTNGSTWLTAPLDHARSGITIADTWMVSDRAWRQQHLRSISQALARAPFAGDAMGLAEAAYCAQTDNLSEFNIRAMELVSGWLGLSTRFRRSSGMGISGSGSSRVLAICQALGATRYVTGHGAAAYLDHVAFEVAGIEVRYMDYALRPYTQLHGDFTPFVTILDAIACCGRGVRELMVSGTLNWREHVDRSR
jgi:hypothetical protein